MHRFSSFMKKTAGWLAAVMIALFICNLACFSFYDPCQELPRQQGATTGFLLPDSHGVYGLEGYCIAHIDDKGYVNRNMPRSKDYIVVAGASHTEGLFIKQDRRYTDLLNDMTFDDGQNHVINIGRSGNYFSVCLQHLDGIVGEFPDAKAYVIETDSLAYDTKALYDSMTECGYDPGETADRLIAALDKRERVRLRAREYPPRLRLIRKQYYTYLGAKEEAEGPGSDILDPLFWKSEYEGDFEKALDDLMKFIRTRTDKQVVILYHPAVKLEEDGTMTILTNNAEPYYEKVCRKNGIDFVDMTQPFLDAYEKEKVVPYGFCNTTLGDGHVNRAAHMMMADELKKVIRW